MDLFASNFSSKITKSEISLTLKDKKHFLKHLDPLGVKVTLYEGCSYEVLPDLIGKQKFEFIIIDEGHSSETV